MGLNEKALKCGRCGELSFGEIPLEDDPQYSAELCLECQLCEADDPVHAAVKYVDALRAAQKSRPYCACDNLDCALEHRPHTPAIEAMIAAKLMCQNIGTDHDCWSEAHQLMALSKLAGRLMEREGL